MLRWHWQGPIDRLLCAAQPEKRHQKNGDPHLSRRNMGPLLCFFVLYSVAVIFVAIMDYAPLLLTEGGATTASFVCFKTAAVCFIFIVDATLFAAFTTAPATKQLFLALLMIALDSGRRIFTRGVKRAKNGRLPAH